VLLLDEPFSAVDRMTRERLKQELAGLRRSLDIPIVLVTHDLDEAQALADRICVIHGGTTLQTGTPDDVRLRPVSPLVARLMGHTNVFEGTLVQASKGGGDGRIRWGGRVLRVATTGGFRDGERLAWLIPSGYIAPANEGAGGNVVKGTLIELTPLGEMTALSVRIKG
jgi:molybdate transport system ATP-binding protein